MGLLRVVWAVSAKEQRISIYQWYRENLGKMAARKFNDGVKCAIQTLAAMPTIGIVEEYRSVKDISLRSFLIHPKYRIIYRFTQRTLYVIAIRATMMQNE